MYDIKEHVVMFHFSFERMKQKRNEVRENIESKIKILNNNIQSDITRARSLLNHY